MNDITVLLSPNDSSISATNYLTQDLIGLANEHGMVDHINITSLIDISFCCKDLSSKVECKLPIFIDTHGLDGNEGRTPLNAVELTGNLQREFGNNLMDWFYTFAEKNIQGYHAPSPKKQQPVAQVISYTTTCTKDFSPKIQFSLGKPHERELWIILRYNLSGSAYDSFIINSHNPVIKRDCIGFQSNEIVITAGIALVAEPSWSTQNRWEGLPYGFSVSGHFISWGKFITIDSQSDNIIKTTEKMRNECSEISKKAFSPFHDDLCVTMLNRIGLNPSLKAKLITSKSCSLLALDFTSLVQYTIDGGVRVCDHELRFLTFYRVESYLAGHPDIFTFSKGVGPIKTLDPRKITLYHYDETKKTYVLFEIEVATREWVRNPKCVRPEDLKYEGIEKRISQYL